MTTIINGSSPSITFSDGSAQTSATRPFQNRIINGAMVVNQRALESGADTTAIVTEKQRLRDITKLADQATTLDELKVLGVTA